VTDLLENPRAGRVKAVAALTKKDVRAETGLFLLEGPQAVREALEYRPELLRELYVTPTAAERYGLADTQVDTWFVTEQVLDAMADTVTPQGVVAVCEQFPTSVRQVFPDRASQEAPDASASDGALPGLVAILE